MERRLQLLESVRPIPSGDADYSLAHALLAFYSAVEIADRAVYRYGFSAPPNPMEFLLGGLFGGENESEEVDPSVNPDPTPLDYNTVRIEVERLEQALLQAEDLLQVAAVSTGTLAVDTRLLATDATANGEIDDWELARATPKREELDDDKRRMYEAMGMPEWAWPEHIEPRVIVTADKADAARYLAACQAALALTNFFLAVDSREQFERAGNLIAGNAQTPFQVIFERSEPDQASQNPASDPQPFARSKHPVLDWVAFAHSCRYPVIDEQRRHEAVKYAESAADAWLLSLDLTQAENDDDNEWLAAPDQDGRFGLLRVDLELFGALRLAGEHAKLVAEGKRLQRFHRGPAAYTDPTAEYGTGVNVRRYLLESSRFDALFALQGSDFVPFLEKGDLGPANLQEGIKRAFAYERQWQEPQRETGDELSNPTE